MTISRSAALLGAVVAISGCYHATIETGLTPGTQTLEKAWASGWLFGLIPPSTVETASRCPNGVARVETQLSFVNMLVSAITLSIYTPMSIQVTCAGPSTGMDEAERSQLMIKEGANLEEKRRAIRDAAELSAKEGHPVLIKFE
ncbi:MAG: Bor family protein [Gemmatimonadetes bacterium]|nr:Bor family protein [Gemmatimonadota bacterium]